MINQLNNSKKDLDNLDSNKICNLSSPLHDNIETSYENREIYLHLCSFTIIRRNSFIFVTICLFLHCSLLLTNYIIDIDIFDKILQARKLSFYYIDRTPSLNEILFYHRISILYNDPYYFEISYENYKKYLVGFDLSTAGKVFENDKRYQTLGVSQAAFLHYKIYLESSQIKKFEHLKNSDVLKLRHEYGNHILNKSGVCQFITSNYGKQGFSQFQGFNESYNYHACMNLRGGIADDGSTKSYDSLFSYIMDEYIDFILNYEIDNNVIPFLSSKLFIATLYSMIFV